MVEQSQFVRDGNRRLVHIVWLPTTSVQADIANLSRDLHSGLYAGSRYQLQSAEENSSRPGMTRLFREGARFLTGRFSVPHVTLMHVFATPLEAAEVFRQLRGYLAEVRTDPARPIAATVNGFDPLREARRWRGGDGERDRVAFLTLQRDGMLAQANTQLGRIVSAGELPSLTPTANEWRPHFTLACKSLEDFPEVTPPVTTAAAVPLGTFHGEIVMGYSGPAGQFRGAVVSLNEPHQPKVPELTLRMHQAFPTVQ